MKAGSRDTEHEASHVQGVRGAKDVGLRLVATDLDGTLLHTDGTVTDRTRGVLEAVEQRGITVVFLTGRPVRWMDALWHHVGEHGLAVCSNGGIVYDVAAHAVAQARPIPREVGLEVAGLIRAALPGSTFALERTTGFGREPDFVPSVHEQRSEVVVGPLEDVFDETVVKMLALHPDLGPEDYWAQVGQLVGPLVTTTWSSTTALIEMSAAGVTKASTLALLCEELGISPTEVVAFGDMPNDVAMLQWAGTAYAMANAHPLTAAAADRIAPRNDEDGVAQVLEELFL